MYFLKILLISLLQFVLLKLHGKVDNISSKCLATKMHQDYIRLVIIFGSIIGAILLLAIIGLIVKIYIKKYRKTT